MAKITAICGKICSGKTYYANQLKEKENAVVLSCDEWHYIDVDLEMWNKNIGERNKKY